MVKINAWTISNTLVLFHAGQSTHPYSKKKRLTASGQPLTYLNTT
jgi:hypothetical protein